MEDSFMVVCRGLPEECKTLWIIPISELKNRMKSNNVKTFKELADGFICPDCRSKMTSAIASLETQVLPEPAR